MASVFNRPDVIAAEQARKKAEADLRLQKAMRTPDPTFLFQYEHEPPDQPNTVGLGLSFPIPLWNRNSGNIAAAQAVLEQSETHLAKVSAQAEADVVTAENSYSAASARWCRYRDEVTPKSRQIREAVAFAYQKGGASLLDLLSAQRNDNDVRLATAQAAADTASAGAALRAALNQ
jgi:cobalt-zinc-cadmium efflux system outer membrane protein